ncbi:MAG: hypothetical protein AAF151_15325, partial [Cyanobacteria bacterium J06656_5]
MLPAIMQMRLKQLEGNANRVLSLLNDYEVELLDESDPGIKNKYRRRIEDLRQQHDNYEKELMTIQAQLTNKQPEEQISIIASQFSFLSICCSWLSIIEI